MLDLYIKRNKLKFTIKKIKEKAFQSWICFYLLVCKL